MMSFIYWIGLIVVVRLICFGIFKQFIDCLDYGPVYEHRTKYFSFVAVPILFAVVLSPLYFEFPNTGFSVPVTFKDGRVIKHYGGLFTRGYRVSNMPLGTVDVSLSVTPITQNPKARTIISTVSVHIEKPKVFYTEKRKKINVAAFGIGSATLNDRSLEREILFALEYWLHEFHNENSVLLGSDFWNPLNENQQKKYRLLAKKWLNKHLAKDGLTVTDARFSVK